LIDTPGFDDTQRKDVDILREIASYMVATYKSDVRLSGLIYLFAIDNSRLGGSAARNLRMFQKLVGREGLHSTILATTKWDNLEYVTIGEQRELELISEDGFWGAMIEHGSKVMRHTRTRESAMSIVKAILSNSHPFALKIQEEMVDQRLVLLDTAAGMQVNKDLIELQQRYQKELDMLKMDMAEVDSEAKREISR
ncbi:uncharacterized protein MYCFIDRAFT_111091, partial [Pseudocercospora fijiensis CIRAD86]